VFLGIMALFSVAAVVTLAGAVVWMLLAEDASPRTGALPGVAFALLVLATVAWKVRGFLRRRVLVGPERLVLRKERGERALDIADIRWIAVAWAWESFRRSPSLLCPNVRIGTATQQWIDLDVDYGAAGRHAADPARAVAPAPVAGRARGPARAGLHVVRGRSCPRSARSVRCGAPRRAAYSRLRSFRNCSDVSPTFTTSRAA
jgi:hypothetical protein